MSLQPIHAYIVPEQTARIATAAFPKGTLCLQLYDHLERSFRIRTSRLSFPDAGNRRRRSGWRS